MKYEHRYRLKYIHEVGSWTKAEILEDEGAGATDALLWASIIYPPDGSLSVAFQSLDGKTNKPLTSKEKFKIWLLMGNYISSLADLEESRKELAAMPFLAVMEGIKGSLQ